MCYKNQFTKRMLWKNYGNMYFFKINFLFLNFSFSESLDLSFLSLLNKLTD